MQAVDDGSALSRLADLLRQRDVLDTQIAAITKRSARQGDVGELIAAQVFDIELAGDAVQAGYDGWFRSGPLQGRTVNIKAYGDAAAGIDISPHECDFYLVLSGPPPAPGGAGPHRWRASTTSGRPIWTEPGRKLDPDSHRQAGW